MGDPKRRGPVRVASARSRWAIWFRCSGRLVQGQNGHWCRCNSSLHVVAYLRKGCKQLYTDLLNDVERTLTWPAQIQTLIYFLVAKTPTGERPIGLTPSIARVWERMSKPILDQWMISQIRSYDWACKRSLRPKWKHGSTWFWRKGCDFRSAPKHSVQAVILFLVLSTVLFFLTRRCSCENHVVCVCVTVSRVDLSCPPHATCDGLECMCSAFGFL